MIYLTRAAGLYSLLIATSSSCFAVLDLQVVPVMHPGNPPSSFGYGSVPYEFSISKFEVTIADYVAFLNAVAASDPNQLYNSNMTTDMDVAGISRSGIDGSYTYSAVGSAQRPITYVSWFDAARFVNWLSNGQPVGSQTNATTETGAYQLTGINSVSGGRLSTNPNTGAPPLFWLPSLDEQYKAAYYQPFSEGGDLDSYWDFPTASNNSILSNKFVDNNAGNFLIVKTNPVQFISAKDSNSLPSYLSDVGSYTNNSMSFYGTFDMAGNVNEWNETMNGTNFGRFGGSWFETPVLSKGNQTYFINPNTESFALGFRVAGIIPEPGVVTLLLTTIFFFYAYKHFKACI